MTGAEHAHTLSRLVQGLITPIGLACPGEQGRRPFAERNPHVRRLRAVRFG